MIRGNNAPYGLKPYRRKGGTASTLITTSYFLYADAAGTTTYGTSIAKGDPVVVGTSLGATPAQNGLVNTISLYAPGFTDGAPSTFATTAILGVFHGCKYQSVNASAITPYVVTPYWPAASQVIPGTLIEALIYDDPTIEYEIQVSTHVNAANNAFVAQPVFPNTTGGSNGLKGGMGSNFGLNVGGGTNFDTVPNPFGGTYQNNPAASTAFQKQSVFYLDVSTVTAAGATHDYNKTVNTLPLKVTGISPNNVIAPGLTLETTPFINVLVMFNNHIMHAGTTGILIVN